MYFQILDSLKSCLLKYFREEERSQHCQWLRDAWGSDFDIRSAFITTVENCSMGWDQVRYQCFLHKCLFENCGLTLHTI